MNKEEVLKRSRNESKDEGKDYYEKVGLNRGYAVFVMISIVIMFAEFFSDTDMRTFYAISALIWGFSACLSYQSSRFKQSRTLLITSIVYAVTCTFSLVTYFKVILG